MRTKPLFDLDALPTRSEVNASLLCYHLYVEKEGVRHYLYWHRTARWHGCWGWQPLAEAGKRKRKTYHDSTSARIARNHWQSKAKDGVVVCIEGYEVAR